MTKEKVVILEGRQEQPEDTPVRDFKTAKRTYDEVWGNAISAKENWQRVAFLEAAALIAAMVIIGLLARAPHENLFVVEKDHIGNVAYAGTVKPVDLNDATWDAVRIQAVKQFLESWRTVTTDTSAAQQNWDRAFAFIADGSQAKQTLSAWFEANDPVARAEKGELVSVHFKTFDSSGKNTYGLWWTEDATSLAGQVHSTKNYRARIVFDLHPLTNEAAKSANPLGLLITELSINEVQ